MRAKVKTPKTSFSCTEMLWLGQSCHMFTMFTKFLAKELASKFVKDLVTDVSPKYLGEKTEETHLQS